MKLSCDIILCKDKVRKDTTMTHPSATAKYFYYYYFTYGKVYFAVER